jgi:hypothetical protein
LRCLLSPENVLLVKQEKKMRKGWKQGIAFCASLVVGLSSGAVTVNFDNGAGTMMWLNPANWVGDVLPGAGG